MEGRILHTVDNSGSPMSPDYVFWCPGCRCGHGVWVTRANRLGAIWRFNGNMERPTFEPSLKVMGVDEQSECHVVVTDGWLNYCGDCRHHLAGKRVPMEPF